jgi:hypothetical protein
VHQRQHRSQGPSALPGHSRWPDPEGRAGSGGTAGKTRGLRRHPPRQTEVQVHGKKVGEFKPKIPDQTCTSPPASCGDMSSVGTLPWHSALPWEEMPRVWTAHRLVPGLDGRMGWAMGEE